jgi:hypothetical protein
MARLERFSIGYSLAGATGRAGTPLQAVARTTRTFYRKVTVLFIMV